MRPIPREEHRCYPRAETPLLLEFANPSTRDLERSYTQNVSHGGMCFPTAVLFQVGHELPMKLELPSRNALIHTMAHVVWVRELTRLGAPQYEVGVQFRWAEDPDRQLFEQHLASLLRRPV